MPTRLFGVILLVVFSLSNGTALLPAAPTFVAGHGFVVRNDAMAPVTIEFQVNNEWKQQLLEVGQDVTLTGDHIRVSTNRTEDGAMITVTLPVAAGKKYRVVVQSGILDFSRVL